MWALVVPYVSAGVWIGISTGLMGLAAWLLARAVLTLDVAALAQSGEAAQGFELQRRQKLGQGSFVYRNLPGLVEQLAAWNLRRARAQESRLRPGARTSLGQLAQNLTASAETLPWRPEEYLACRQIESGGVGFLGLALAGLWFDDIVMPLCVAAGALVLWLQLSLAQVAGRARRRRDTIRRRLPFALDMLALMMEAGASFPEALTAVVNENREHPLGKELGEVVRETSLGRTRKESLQALQQRLADEDISELVFALVKGEEMGTPLAETLRAQAGQLLLKQVQWVEKESAEAQVLIVFPGMIIMLACLLIIVAPFVLSALYNAQ
jgi:tight adherence protein C